jgi:preprotein translocase subunit YajC
LALAIALQGHYIAEKPEKTVPLGFARRARRFQGGMVPMFVTEAFAQGAPGAGGGSFLIQLLPFIMILGIMYFLIIRPQQKRLKDHRDMIGSIKRGDTVVTAGGLVGKVTKLIGDAELQVELAEGVRVRVVRQTISEVRTRGDVRDVEAKRAIARNDNDDDIEDEAEDDRAAKKTGRTPAEAANKDV